MSFIDSIPKPPAGSLPYIVAVIGGLIAWRMFSGNREQAPATVVQTGYDPQLVALGTQSALKQAELQQQKEIALAAMDTELKTAEQAGMITRYVTDSEERKFGGQMVIDNAALSVQQTLGLRQADLQAVEIAQSYNLKNYQTMVTHDLGKKGIGVNFEGIGATQAGMTSKDSLLGGIANGVIGLFGNSHASRTQS